MNEEEVKKILKTMKVNLDKKYLKSRNSVAIESALNLLEKKDKIIDEMAPRVYLNKEEIEEMKKYIWTSNKSKDFSSFVKQYFERKVENEN